MIAMRLRRPSADIFPADSCNGGSMIKTVIGSFDSADDADRATRDLRSIGFADADINLVVSNVRQGDGDTELPAIGDGTGPVAKGAVAGGVLGGAAGLAVSLAGLAVPGIGPS